MRRRLHGCERFVCSTISTASVLPPPPRRLWFLFLSNFNIWSAHDRVYIILFILYIYTSASTRPCGTYTSIYVYGCTRVLTPYLRHAFARTIHKRGSLGLIGVSWVRNGFEKCIKKKKNISIWKITYITILSHLTTVPLCTCVYYT